MQTLKIKYITSDDNLYLIKEYQKQYSNVLHYAYNRAIENNVEKDIETNIKNLNNIPLMECFFIRSAVKESMQLVKTNKNKLIFGGKSNFIKRCQNKISKEQYLEKRLSPLYSLGEANQKANRKFKINEDCNSFLFKPCKSTHITLEIAGGYRKYKKLLNKLYKLQETKAISISYKLDSEYIYVCFDENILTTYNPYTPINNRIFSIDLNPNYVGWSVVDWKSSSDFNVVKSGVISIKTINDKEFALKKAKKNPNGLSSDHPQRIYLNNKREHEVYEICKNLVNKCLYYKCEMFCMEDLSMESSDKSRGKKYNRLCNNVWNRDKFINNITKRCNIFKIKLLKVCPEFTSFIGNFLYRGLGLPDMVLASIEIGRRGYEFNNQYIKKISKIQKNIIQPKIKDFIDRYTKSLEEFGIEGEGLNFSELYYRYFKNTKRKYRVSLDELHLKFCRCFSKASLIMQML